MKKKQEMEIESVTRLTRDRGRLKLVRKERKSRKETHGTKSRDVETEKKNVIKTKKNIRRDEKIMKEYEKKNIDEKRRINV